MDGIFLSGKVCICRHDWDILEEKHEVEDVDCVTQYMDHDVTCLNLSILCGIHAIQRHWKRAPAILNKYVFSIINTNPIQVSKSSRKQVRVY